MYSQELYHHGIEGQRWGKRNGPPYPLSYKSKSSSEKKYSRKAVLNNAKKLSDEELKARTKRLTLENNYVEQYKKQYPDKKTIGKQYADRVKDGLIVAASAATVKLVKDFIVSQTAKR